MIDGGLRAKLIAGIPKFHWQAVETSVSRGLPDLEFCSPLGISGWVECKRITSGSDHCDHPPTPEQVSWLERRSRYNGRCFIAVRRYHSGGPRLGKPVDRLYLMLGDQVRPLLLGGIRTCLIQGTWDGGPARWNWAEIEKTLVSEGLLYR